MIHGRLAKDGRLTEIGHRGARFPDDVALTAMPAGMGPFAYDAVRKAATAATLTAEERAERVVLPRALVAALTLRTTTRPLTSEQRAWAQAVIDAAAAGLQSVL